MPGLDASWAEALTIGLEERNGVAWLLLEPDIWIAPLSKRDLAVDFSRKRRLKRYNEQANRILVDFSAFIKKFVGAWSHIF